MANETPNPTHRPRAGAELTPLSYTLGVLFHPQIKLERKAGFDFASVLSDVIEPQGVDLQPNLWTFSQPHGKSAAGGLQVTISQTTVQFDIAHPSHRLEWIEQRCEMVLSEFQKKFSPQMALSSSACFRGTMDVDGDARSFLATHVMHIDTARVQMLHRPIHLLGIRFFLPPYQAIARNPEGKRLKKPTTVVDWHADIKAESLIEDPSKLFLEAEAEWPSAIPWEGSTIRSIVGHLATTKKYLEEDVVTFLKSASVKSGEEGDMTDTTDTPEEPK